MDHAYQRFHGLAWGLLLLIGSSSAAAERFRLQVPGQADVSSAAELSGDRLTVIDANGTSFVYQHRRDLDTPNGRFLGFYCRAADRYLRWPVSGSGTMYLGSLQGPQVVWRESRMQIQAEGPPRSAATRFEPSGQPVSSSAHFAVLAHSDGRFTAAQIDSTGALHYYGYERERWERLEASPATRLDPASPLVLLDTTPAGLPDAYLVDGRGQLTRVTASRVEILSTDRLPQLAPYSYLERDPLARSTALFVIDTAGRLWQLDVLQGDHQLIEPTRGSLQPGGRVTIVDDGASQLFVVDRQGRLLRYIRGRSARWQGPEQLSVDLMPAGRVAAVLERTPAGDDIVNLAAIGADGTVRMLHGQHNDWREASIGRLDLARGSSLELLNTEEGLALSAIGYDGVWRTWRRGSGRWMAESIGDGFLAGSPVAFYGPGPVGFAVDRRGRLVTAHRAAGRWRRCLCSPHFRFAPQLTSRQVVPNPALPPIQVQLANGHRDELVVRVYDRRQDRRPVEVSVKPGESQVIRVERDPGAVWEEVYLVPGPLGTLVEQVHQWPVPPQGLYDVVVYANRVTSVYFDRTTNSSDVPDSTQKSLVSVGVFPLPPGDLLQDGDRIDVYGEARHQENPGAVAWYGRP